jgi:hypothetical protein
MVYKLDVNEAAIKTELLLKLMIKSLMGKLYDGRTRYVMPPQCWKIRVLKTLRA